MGDGTQRRAFLYIDDFLDAMFKLDRYVEREGNLTVNVGSTEETTIRKLAEMVIELSGRDIPLRFDPSKPTGVLSRLPDLDRIGRCWAGSQRQSWLKDCLLPTCGHCRS